MPKNEILFTVISAAFFMGIIISDQSNITKFYLDIIITPLFTVNLLLLIRYLYGSIKVFNYSVFFGFGIIIVLVILGFYHHYHYKNVEIHNNFSKTTASFLKVKVITEPTQKGDILKCQVSVLAAYANTEIKSVSGKLLVLVKLKDFSPAQPSYGDIYVIPGKFSQVKPPKNPAEFNYQSWLAYQSIYHQIFLRQNELILIKKNEGNPIINYSLKLRKRQVDVYRKIIVDDEAFAVASTLILGYRSDLSEDTLSAYSKTGTIHALSVSGMHVGIIYMVIEFLLQYMNRHRQLKICKTILVILLIWSYTILTGCSASVLRSAIMITVFIIAKVLNRNSNSYNIVAFSAFCLSLYNPMLLWDVGFQLSYMAVFGLIYLQPKIQSIFDVKNRWLKILWSTVCLSTAAQLMTFPFSLYYFHQFPLYFLISNLFITIPIAVMMYIGIIILIFHFYWLAPAFEFVIVFTNKSLSWIANLPYASLGGLWIDRISLGLLCLFILILLEGISRKNRHLLWLSGILLAALQIRLMAEKTIALKQRTIILFSLSQNYATAFIDADSAVIVTDLTKDNKEFRFHIQPALDQLHIKYIMVTDWQTETHLYGMQIKEHQLRWKNYHVLLLDAKIDHKILKYPMTFDAVWIHQSPDLSLLKHKNLHIRKSIWVDATNRITTLYPLCDQDIKVNYLKDRSTVIDLRHLDK